MSARARAAVKRRLAWDATSAGMGCLPSAPVAETGRWTSDVVRVNDHVQGSRRRPPTSRPPVVSSRPSTADAATARPVPAPIRAGVVIALLSLLLVGVGLLESGINALGSVVQEALFSSVSNPMTSAERRAAE